MVFIPRSQQKKISAESGIIPRGRPPKRKIRHDLVIWHKSKDTLRAIIEIKKVYGMTDGLRNDAKKIRVAMKGQNPAESGYLIIFRNFPGGDDESKVFKRWADELNLKYVMSAVLNSEENKGWTEAYCLLKAK